MFSHHIRFFHNAHLCINYRAIGPNFWTLIRLVALHAATTSTCERSFKLNKQVKTSICSTMTNKRMNHLSVSEYYKEELKKIDIDALMNEFVHSLDEQMRIFSPNVLRFKK